jgi:radical SAM superfamily enzyme YgiQ (UPF0313 family)
MKILFMSMPDTVDFLNLVTKIPNLATVSLAGVVEGHEVAVLDLVTVKPHVRKAVTDTVRAFSPDIVALSAMTFQFDTLLRVAALVRDLAPQATIVAGGYHATLMAEELTADGQDFPVDFIVRGEGEATFRELVEALASGVVDFSGINGLSYRQGGLYIHNPLRELTDLASLPLPNRAARLKGGFHFYGTPMDVVETSRGCPFNCKFCSITHMYGHTFRPFPIDRVVEDLRRVKAAGGKLVFFVDDNLTYNVEHFKTVCDAIIANGLNDIEYMIQASAVGLANNPWLVEAMDRANFRIVFVGFESMDPTALKGVKKPSSPEINTKAAQLLRQHGMCIIVGGIIGFPEDNAETIRKQAKMLRSLGGDTVYLQHLTPYPKTRIRKELLELDLVVNKDDYSNYTGFACNIRTKHLSHKELKEAKRRAIRTFALDYISPRSYFFRNRTWFHLSIGLNLLFRDVFYKIFDRLNLRQHDMT